MKNMRTALTTILVGLASLATASFAAAPKYDPGASATEIRIGNTAPQSGPLAVLGAPLKAVAAYFKKVNAEGGVNGRRINLISYDDGYNPAKTVELTRRLVEEDKVLLIFASVGTAQNAAIQNYLNSNKVPHLFVQSGASRWDDPANFPWTMGSFPSYQTEARIYAQYLMKAHPDGKIAVLYQNDDYGRDFLKGLKDGLRDKLPVIAEASYQLADTSLNAQIGTLKASGADILVDASTARFTVMAIRRMAEIGWKPVHVVNYISVPYISIPGLDNEGILSGAFLKNVGDGQWKDDPGMQEYLAFMDKYYPEGDKGSVGNVYGYMLVQTMVQVLKQCGDDLTRENVMRQAANLDNLQLGALLPGIVMNTSAADYSPLEQLQMMRFTGGRLEQFGNVLSGIDPGAVSDGFKAIFKYGSATRQTASQLNANTVTMMTGTFGGTYVEVGADLATVLDDGDSLRLLPVVGRGSVQGIADILFLKGVDAGIFRSDTLDYLESKGYASNVKKQLSYILRLYNEEMHVLAPRRIRTLADLDGKTVAVDLPDGGTFVTSINVFERLGIKPHFLYIEQRIALEKLRRGEIGAVIAVEGKPLQSIEQIADENLHFVPVAYDQVLQDAYLPAQFTSNDYPGLIRKGERVNTIAAAAVLGAYNWAPNTDRYRRLAHFVEALFTKIKELQRPPFHPKWKEVALNATMPGWTRFRPAQEWLDRHASDPAVAEFREKFEKFEQFVSSRRAAGDVRSLDNPNDREALFREFLESNRK
jgi:branched-chain amino acid transport system substrate-binding protein